MILSVWRDLSFLIQIIVIYIYIYVFRILKIINSICREYEYSSQYSLIHLISMFYSVTGIFFLFLSNFSRLLKYWYICDMVVATSEK